MMFRKQKILKAIAVTSVLYSTAVFAYQEDDSFGSIKPDAPAKPAKTDVYQRREAPPEESEVTSPQSETAPRPKYRDIYDRASERDRSYGDEESVGVSVGVGFGFRSFSGSLGLTVPANRYIAWGVSGFYSAYEEDTIAEEKSGGELALIFRIPNPTPITPFVSAGPGYESWQRSADDGNGLEVFDTDSSPTGNWSVGASLRLARYVSLVGALKSTTYTERPPRSFDGKHTTRELRTNERFELGFAFTF